MRSEVLAELQEKSALPVATTTMGKGAIDETHPLSLGVIGYFMGPGGVARYQRPLVESADVILLIGTRTNQNGTDSWMLLPRGATFIHLDIDRPGDRPQLRVDAAAGRCQGDAGGAARGVGAARSRQTEECPRCDREADSRWPGPASRGSESQARVIGHAHPPRAADGRAGSYSEARRHCRGGRELLLDLDRQLSDGAAAGPALHHARVASPASAGACRWRSARRRPGPALASSHSAAMAVSPMSGRSWRRRAGMASPSS